MKFTDLALSEVLQSALERLQFVEPTEIQEAVIEKALAGQDIMACAETGSGKTAAYGLPIIERLLQDKSKASMILAPTRELAKQIADVMRDFTSSIEGFRIATLVGGSDMAKQVRALKRKPRLIIGTPGRINDHLRRRTLKLKNIQVLALDEGDRMLDMGFAPQLDDILMHLPEKKQALLFTATLPNKVKDLAQRYLQDPELVEVGRKSLPVEAIKQSIVELSPKEKSERIIDELNARQGQIVVFMRTKSRVDDLAKNLKSYGFKVESIHGDKTQGRRNRAIKNFKEGKARILVATDVAARGLDVPAVEHVINYDLPRMDEDYVHRIGRTARNGAEGEALSFVSPSDQKTWLSLVKKYRIPGCELVKYKAEKKKPRRSSGSKKKSKFKKKFSAKGSGKKKTKKKFASSGAKKKSKKKFSAAKSNKKNHKKKSQGFRGRAKKSKGTARRAR